MAEKVNKIHLPLHCELDGDPIAYFFWAVSVMEFQRLPK